MQDTRHEVDITPDKSLVGKLGMVGYRTDEAIAELIDNAVDARILGNKETIHVIMDFVNRTVTVRDDGRGMDREMLAGALTIAKRGDDNDSINTSPTLGRFGMGMKSACTSLGKSFSIRTSEMESDREYGAKYDEEGWLADKSQEWKNFGITERVLHESQDWHGTEVNVWNLNVSLYHSQTAKFRERFAIRYAPYLESGDVSIRINNTECKPAAQDLVDGSKIEVSIQLLFGAEIKGWLALLKKRSIRGNYGIHLFWNGRLIEAFSKFGFAAHPENARIIGRLDLDHVPVNYTKTGFLRESTEYKNAMHAFEESDVLKSILRKSRTGPRSIPAIQSVFEYFAGNGKPQKLDGRLRANAMRDAMNDAEPFVINVHGKSARIDFVSGDVDSELYSINHTDDTLEVQINCNSRELGYVKNHLYLMGVIASEVSVMLAKPKADPASILVQKNHKMAGFLSEWAEQKTPTVTQDGRHAPDDAARYIPNYNLDKCLVAAYDYLDQHSEFAFQFTAMSTLAPYLHTARGKMVYTVYTIPHRGRYVADLLGEAESDGNMIPVCKPDTKTMDALLEVQDIRDVIAVRESSRGIRPSIASPEKAFADLAAELYMHKIPTMDDLELNRIFFTMADLKLVNINNVKKYVRTRKIAERLDAITETPLA